MPKYEVNRKAVAHARRLIDVGHYVIRSRWEEVQPSAPGQNAFLKSHNWEEYGAWHLGVKIGTNPETKNHYGFVFGDLRRVHRSALIAVESPRDRLSPLAARSMATDTDGMKVRRSRLGAVGIGCFVLVACTSGGSSSPTSATVPATSSTSVPSTSSTTATTTPTTVPATTPPSTTATTIPSTTTSTTIAPAVPGRVSGVHAEPGGGIGEVIVRWNAEPNTTGYRVYRSDSPDGEFVLVADINIVNGNTTAAADVTNIWTTQHSYVPSGGALATRDTSPVFEYVEFSSAGERCFKVRAYNAAGRGHSSSVTCASPPA